MLKTRVKIRKSKNWLLLVSLGLLTLSFSKPILAQSFWDQFIDPRDGQLDVSDWVLQKRGVLPVPILVTEPTVGFGGGIAALYFHEQEEDKDRSANKDPVEVGEEDFLSLPPSVSGIVGLGTENGSWLGGGMHFGSWKQDRFRYLGGLVYASLNLEFFGFGEQNDRGENSGLGYKIKGLYFIQELKYRLFDSDFFIGGQYTLLSSESSLDIPEQIPGITDEQLDLTDTALGILLSYDSRDTIFTPNKGARIDIEALFHDQTFGGDLGYQKFKTAGIGYWGVHPKVVLGARLDGRFSDGDTPFYALPYIDLRGIRALRYQDDIAVMGEVEARWNVYKRWSLTGFTGVGRTASNISELEDASSRHTIGAGVRYYIAKRLGLHTGIDIAHGPEEWIFYLQVGTAWNR